MVKHTVWQWLNLIVARWAAIEAIITVKSSPTNHIIIIIIILYLPSAVFIAQVLVGPSKQLKQIIQIKHNIVKNPNWPEANQLAIYKRGGGFELGRTEKQIQVVARAGLEPGTAGLRVRHADHSTTLPPSLALLLHTILQLHVCSKTLYYWFLWKQFCFPSNPNL